MHRTGNRSKWFEAPRWTSTFSALVYFSIMAVAACGGERERQAPLRSPTRDYPLPPPTTSDGRVVGADEKTPADKLVESPTNEGPAPGWSVEEEGLRYDPQRPAGATDQSVGADSDHQKAPANSEQAPPAATSKPEADR